MIFRRALKEEINIIVDMCEEIKKTYPFWDEEYPIYENFLESFEEDGLYVLEVDKEIVGSISFEYGTLKSKDAMTLSRFMVKVGNRNKGYGKFIFESLEKEIIEKNIFKIEFLVHKDHPFAFKMYQSFGYQDQGLYATEWDEGFPHYHLFTKKLS